MSVMSETAIEIYEEVEDLIETVGHTYFDACVIVAWERCLNNNVVMEITEELEPK